MCSPVSLSLTLALSSLLFVSQLHLSYVYFNCLWSCLWAVSQMSLNCLSAVTQQSQAVFQLCLNCASAMCLLSLFSLMYLSQWVMMSTGQGSRGRMWSQPVLPFQTNEMIQFLKIWNIFWRYFRHLSYSQTIRDKSLISPDPLLLA